MSAYLLKANSCPSVPFHAALEQDQRGQSFNFPRKAPNQNFYMNSPVLKPSAHQTKCVCVEEVCLSYLQGL